MSLMFPTAKLIEMNNRIKSRKTWDQTRTETKHAFLLPQPVAKVDRDYNMIREDIPPAYEDYLTLLGRKNREKRELSQPRGPRDLREEGFSLYFNGTHAKRRSRSKTGETTKPKQTKVSDWVILLLLSKYELKQTLHFPREQLAYFPE